MKRKKNYKETENIKDIILSDINANFIGAFNVTQ